MKNKTIQRIKNSKFGRLLCRIVGEDTGAIMMEYVLVAMLIAAATVAAATYFGRSAQGMFGAMSRAIWGDSAGALTNIDQGRKDAVSNDAAAQTEGGRYSTLEQGSKTAGQNTSGGTSTGGGAGL